MKPVIGVMPLWDENKDSIWMLPGYMDGIMQAGGLPVMFPFSADAQEIDQLVDMCDGFLFTGGHDVCPDLYNEIPLEGLIVSCRKRDVMESIVLEKAIEKDKPVLGICRGIQFINAFLGGTLYQDLPTQHPSEISHRQAAPYDRPSHNVSIVKGSPLHDALALESLPVNSCHHQAVKDVAPGFKVVATAPDGVIEAIEGFPQYNILAVQWHPEYFAQQGDAQWIKIFEDLVQRAGGGKTSIKAPNIKQPRIR